MSNTNVDKNLSAKKFLVKSSIGVFISNIFLVISGLLTGFVVPNLMGVVQYGYFETFILYASYTTFFQLGFINGIYLLYGDKNLEDYNQEKFRMFFKLFLGIQFFVSLIIAVIGIVVFKNNTLLVTIVLSLSIYNLSSNVMTYFQIISQITMRFKEYFSRTLFQSLFKVVIVIVVFVIFFALGKNDVDYRIYLSLYILLFLALATWYLYTYRDIVFGKSERIRDNWKIIFDIFKKGFPLLIADIIVVLIYRVDRQIINGFFDNKIFGYYSFAYAISALVLTLISSLNTTFYPILKRSKTDHFTEQSQKFYSIILFATAFFQAGFFLIAIIVSKWLPKYYDSLHTLQILFPTMMVTAVINTAYQNIFKTLYKNGVYSIIASIILVVTIGLNIGAYFIFKNVDAIAYATLISFIIWYITLSLYLRKTIKLKVLKNSIIMAIFIFIFFAISFISKSPIKSFVIFLVCYLLVFIFTSDISKTTNISGSKRGLIENLQEKYDKLNSNKKSLALIVSSLFAFCLTLNFSGALLFDSRVESIASVVSYEASRANGGIVYSEILSNTPSDSFQNFLYVTRKNYDYTMKKIANSYIYAAIDDDVIPFAVKTDFDDSFIELNVVSTPSNYLNSLDIGFEFCDGSDYSKDNTFLTNATDIFLTETVVKKVFNIDFYSTGIDYSSYIGRFLSCKTSNGALHSNFVLKGVIKDDSTGLIGNKFTNNFVLSNTTFSLNYLSLIDKTLSIIYHPGKTSLTTYMKIHEMGMGQENYHQVFYNDVNGEFLIGNTQSKINSIEGFYKNSVGRLVGFVILYIVSFAFLVISFKKSIGQFKKYKPFLLLIIALVYIFSVLLLQAIDFIFIGKFFLLLNSYSGIVFSFIVFVLLILLCESLIKANTQHKDNKNYEFLEISI